MINDPLAMTMFMKRMGARAGRLRLRPAVHPKRSLSFMTIYDPMVLRRSEAKPKAHQREKSEPKRMSANDQQSNTTE